MNTRKTAVRECLEALQRGVQQPTIVRTDTGYEYVPGAYLTDISYTGSREVVHIVTGDEWGSMFDPLEATDLELDEAAEFAATEWEW